MDYGVNHTSTPSADSNFGAQRRVIQVEEGNGWRESEGDINEVQCWLFSICIRVNMPHSSTLEYMDQSLVKSNDFTEKGLMTLMEKYEDTLNAAIVSVVRVSS